MTPAIFFNLGADDLMLYYGHTFLKAKWEDSPKHEWIYIDSFSTDSRNIQATFVTKHQKVTRLPLTSLHWNFDIPQSGAYNYKNTVVLVSRIPVRHTSKGASKNNIHFQNLMQPLCRLGVIPQEFYKANDFAYTVDGLNLLFEETEPVSLDKGLVKILKHQSLAFAVNPRISISQGIISKKPAVWLKDRIIGEFDPKKDIIFPLYDDFIPELTDTFADTGITIQT